MLIMDKCVTDEYVGFDSPTYMSQSCKIISMKTHSDTPIPDHDISRNKTARDTTGDDPNAEM